MMCSIDFGKSNDDPARGYWVQCSEFVDEDDDENDEGMATGKQKKKKKKGKPESVDVWYKFETPHKLYEKFAIKMEFLVVPLSPCVLFATIYPHRIF